MTGISTPTAGKEWIFLASDLLACVADTRRLALEHQFVWYTGWVRPSPMPGDMLMLGFKRNLSLIPLGLFQTVSPESVSAVAAGTRYGECVALLPEALREQFTRARPGREGGGLVAFLNPQFRAIALRLLDPFQEEWARAGTGMHDCPNGFSFDLRKDVFGGRDRYLLPVEDAVVDLPRVRALMTSLTIR